MLKGRNKSVLRLMAVISAAVLVILTAAILLSISRADIIRKGVRIEGEKIGGKSINEARAQLLSTIENKYADSSFTLTYNAVEWKYKLDAIEYDFKIDDALDKGFNLGRDGNFLKKLYNSISIAISGMDINIETQYSKEKLISILEKIKKDIDTRPQNAFVLYEKGNIEVKKHIDGKILDVDKNIMKIEESLKNRDFNKIPLSIEITAPKIRNEDVEYIDSIISVFNTRFSLNDSNRGDNIRLACERINGRILKPGEKFSMNSSLGPRTLENGFKEAPIIFQNELVQGTGGGICQVTTTLYNAILLAKLKVIERSPHSMPLGYVRPGQDATISGNSIDFKFENIKNYAVCLNTEVIGGKIIIRILGKSDKTKGKVKLHSQIVKIIDPGEEEVEIDKSLADGERIMVRKSRRGIRVVLYRDTYSEDNLLIDREKISEDYYKPVKGQVKTNGNFN